ncbi:hypothetical protein SAMD00019534_010240 [Acytostelium subglobosum LB1]|uniref:hypothetical protein n=1 Tax=Acytostelium subglobosum LB1 TaxID=1410327 RepID=UPI000645048E|nr:hypothetical protein SAMD00019534_010240 [Acytostelium subglobosum LB1]GAM17849.1 hypothetical protein SAMD00019534_010240 [Acytostelium subglobosum LB1]|eukprot:XP_012758445.1 hypothetical protein SAMD00019534_010240 [Acytostelium subglobosum LB1]
MTTSSSSSSTMKRSSWMAPNKNHFKYNSSLRQRLDDLAAGPISELIVLRVSIPDIQSIVSFKVQRDYLVKDLLNAIIKKKRLLNNLDGQQYALYIAPNNAKADCGVWLDESKPLWIYELYDKDMIECKKKQELEQDPAYLKVVFPEQMKTKTFQVDLKMLVRDAIQMITSKFDVLYFVGQDLKYYGLFVLNHDGSEVLLQEDSILESYALGNLSIIEFKKKDVIVLSLGEHSATTIAKLSAAGTPPLLADTASAASGSSSSTSSSKSSSSSSLTYRASYVVPTNQVTITFSTKSLVKDIVADLSPWLESLIKVKTINYKLMLSEPKLWLIESNPISSYNIKKSDKLYLFPKIDDSINNDDGICLNVMFSACNATDHFATRNKLSKSIPGEILILKIDNVVHLTDCINGQPGGLEGDLFMTNYRLKFFETVSGLEYDIPLYSISRVERVGSSKSNTNCYLDISCKDFRFVRFFFPHPNDKRNTSRKKLYKTLKQQVFPGNQTKLFAFYNKEHYPVDGWSVFNLEEEYKRQGVGKPGSGWRITNVNAKYEKCDTYPSLLAIPERINDSELDSVFKFRSRGRIPALSWKHPYNGASITRCSQPLVGITRSRCTEDEMMFREIGSPRRTGDRSTSKSSRSSLMINVSSHHHHTETKTLCLLDARPKANAIGNRAMGAGYENTSTCYPESTLDFLNIENIHVMRDSLDKFKSTCFAAVGGINGQYSKEQKTIGWFNGIDASKWFEHLVLILEGAVKIADKVHNANTSVLIHCSDGWDRTAQLSSISMLLLDPYFRTIEGFIVLIEKEWLSFGHKFAQRIGHGDAKHGDEQRSPVFLQFIECVYHILNQFQQSFEFNQNLLMEILHNLFSCRFGTFLFNSERERVNNNVKTQTVSLWSYVLANRDNFRNTLYVRDERVLPLRLASPLFSVWKDYYFQHLLPSTDEHNQSTLALQKEIRHLQRDNEELRRQVITQPPSSIFSTSTISLASVMSSPMTSPPK